jgi:hypothetical protein
MRQEFCYIEYVFKKTVKITRIFDNVLQVKICIFGIKWKPQGRLTGKLIGELHSVNFTTLISQYNVN